MRHASSLRRRAQRAGAERFDGLGLGLFMWGNDDAAGPAKYRLLIEGAKYFDENGFAAVWTPERHFHAFGGPYPNPAVTGAAVAAVTKNVKIRAGSCVVPLHHPIRIAEEWAVVDNLSNGRVEIAAASGWNPNDFVLRPESHANSKQVMFTHSSRCGSCGAARSSLFQGRSARTSRSSRCRAPCRPSCRVGSRLPEIRKRGATPARAASTFSRTYSVRRWPRSARRSASIGRREQPPASILLPGR